MLQGLRRSWKQPVAFYFVNSKTNSIKLAECIREVLDIVCSTGLVVLATISDMGTNNVKALQLLGASFENPSFYHKSRQIFTIYDPPHLLKCTRNLFLKYSVDFPMQFAGEEMTNRADIQVVKNAFEMDRNEVVFRCVPKITFQHLAPDSFSKMKVSLAAQLFSHSVACLIFYNMSRGTLGNHALGTATFLRDVDMLFDSFNGRQLYPNHGKDLRSAVSDFSSHLAFWEAMKHKISHWRFVGYIGHMPPSQKGWLANLKAVVAIWERCKSMGLNHLRTRSLNQDALENMFGGLRSYCGDNCNPTNLQFVSCLKTHIINGLTNIGIRGTNCESDSNELLSNLQTFLRERTSSDSRKKTKSSKTTDNHMLENMIENAGSSFDFSIFDGGTAYVYVSGFITKQILKNFNCDLCKTALTSHPNQWINDFITFKEYSDYVSRLTYPSQDLVDTVTLSANIVESMLPNICHTAQVAKQLTDTIFLNADFSWISCTEHISFLKEGIVGSVCRICIPWYCMRINRGFKSSTSKRASRKMAILNHT